MYGKVAVTYTTCINNRKTYKIRTATKYMGLHDIEGKNYVDMLLYCLHHGITTITVFS